MVSLSALYLAILLSAVAVFLVSSIVHMVLPYHRSDYRPLPSEDTLIAAFRAAGLQRGVYHFPFCTHKDMKSPAMQEKFKQGPIGLVTVFPTGPVKMGKFLGLWFVFCLIVAFFVAYIACHTVAAGAPFRHVLRATSTAAFLAFGLANLSNGIWKGQPWSNVLKEVFDGLIYALVTGAVFAYFWPH